LSADDAEGAEKKTDACSRSASCAVKLAVTPSAGSGPCGCRCQP
jgi:hypothetical protein